MTQLNNTELLSPGYTRGYVWGIFSLALTALVILFFLPDRFIIKQDILGESPISVNLFFAPWVLATGRTISNSLSEWSFRYPSDSLLLRILLLYAILLIFVVLPTFFLLAWRQRRINQNDIKQGLSLSGAGYVYSTVLLGFFILGLIPTTIHHEITRKSLQSAQTVQRNRDYIINEICIKTLDVYQYRLLPKSLGGGEGSYIGYLFPAKESKSQYASYSVKVVNANEVQMTAQSLAYSNASVGLTIDITGQMKQWNYTGEYQ
ncbi:MAG: hypothetical protein V1799_13140 [bacterium]